MKKENIFPLVTIKPLVIQNMVSGEHTPTMNTWSCEKRYIDHEVCQWEFVMPSWKQQHELKNVWKQIFIGIDFKMFYVI